MGSLGEDMVLGDRETMPILFDESRVGVLPLGSERMCADGIELGSRDFGPDGLFGQRLLSAEQELLPCHVLATGPSVSPSVTMVAATMQNVTDAMPLRTRRHRIMA